MGEVELEVHFDSSALSSLFSITPKHLWREGLGHPHIPFSNIQGVIWGSELEGRGGRRRKKRHLQARCEQHCHPESGPAGGRREPGQPGMQLYFSQPDGRLPAQPEGRSLWVFLQQLGHLFISHPALKSSTSA